MNWFYESDPQRQTELAREAVATYESVYDKSTTVVCAFCKAVLEGASHEGLVCNCPGGCLPWCRSGRCRSAGATRAQR